MRAVRLAAIALEAEGARISLGARRWGRRAVFGAVAAVAGIACFAVLHLLAWHALAPSLMPVPRAAVLAGFDAVLALVCGLVASRGSETQMEQEARAVRDLALSGAATSLVPPALIQAFAIGRVIAGIIGRRPR
ncbi:hypothetical protein C8P66_11042 [Humitalea rosea]|uniref:Uncharacterized protein n=1 Tax=Humitalea rosea TaxID=990373 RepID=A0A2W7IGR8_9PROT|nr:hypothetical protein [Humitalea rosea]PZW45844.1 hypothetical protein C8P66_11042 [Humitalea rosea]